LGNERNDLTQADGIALDSLPKWLRDLIDYNNESAGRETGRARRFFSSDGADLETSEQKKDERRFNALMRLLQDPEYMRLYGDVAKAIDDAEDAAARALAKLSREGERALERLDDIKYAAATLNDGRRVYRAADGRIYTEDGDDVTDQEKSIRGLSANSPSWEEFKTAKEALVDIVRRRREVEDYLRDVVDPAKLRLSDPDHPPSDDELKDILNRLKTSQPADVRAAQEAMTAHEARTFANTAAAEYVGEAPLKTPDAFSHFKVASAVISEDPFASPAPTTAPKNT
jgi:hypothetical protein